MDNKIKGTRDYYNNEAVQLNYVFEVLKNISKKFNLTQAYTPTIENTSLFNKAVGNTTDVVNKEMYTFDDKKGRSISLKPEGTSSVARMAIENKLFDTNKNIDLFYIDSMFRYERPQKGRQRQFFQYGVEKYGRDCIYVDYETISIGLEILQELGIEKYELQINSIGSSSDRDNYNSALRAYITEKYNDLSDYAKEKFDTGNLVRIFDSKIDSDLELLENAPKLSEFISPVSRITFAKTKKILDANKIKYIVNPNLIRGLDYYNDLVFEFVSTDIDNLGSKSTIIGGGRYDKLISKMTDDQKDVPAIGFAIGIERLMLAAKNKLKSISSSIDYAVVVAYAEDEMQMIAINIARELRDRNYVVSTDYSSRKLNKKLDGIKKETTKNIIIIGNETISENKITVKNLITNKTKKIDIKDL